MFDVIGYILATLYIVLGFALIFTRKKGSKIGIEGFTIVLFATTAAWILNVLFGG